jgi:hypothetical protein
MHANQSCRSLFKNKAKQAARMGHLNVKDKHLDHRHVGHEVDLGRTLDKKLIRRKEEMTVLPF